MNEQEREQNKKINEHSRRLTRLEQQMTTNELDLAPGGRISMAFDAVEEDLDEIKSAISKINQRLDRNEYRFNQVDAKLDVIINHLTGISDLPEE